MADELVKGEGSSTINLEKISNGPDGSVITMVNGIPTWVVPTPLSNATTGILTGGVVTINSGDNQTFDVTAGTGVIEDWTVPATPVRYEVSWTAFTAEAIPNLAGIFTTICINNAGAIVKTSGVLLTEEKKSTQIVLQSAIHVSGTQIDSIGGSSIPAYNKAEGALEYISDIGPFSTGNDYTANATDLQIAKSSGTTALPWINRNTSPMNPTLITNAAQTPVNPITRSRRDGSGGFIFLSGNTVIDPSFYDDGSATLQAVGVNNWTIKDIYFFGLNGATTIIYGQVVYNNLTDAQDALVNSDHNPIISPLIPGQGFLSAHLIVRNAATDLSDVGDAVFVDASQ